MIDQRFIDATSFKVTVTRYCEAKVRSENRKALRERVSELCRDICLAIDDAPSADVRENVSARWIGMDSNSERYDDVRCSNCGRVYTVDAYHWCDIGFIKDDLKYCPNCGASMRVVKDES